MQGSGSTREGSVASSAALLALWPCWPCSPGALPSRRRDRAGRSTPAASLPLGSPRLPPLSVLQCPTGGCLHLTRRGAFPLFPAPSVRCFVSSLSPHTPAGQGVPGPGARAGAPRPAPPGTALPVQLCPRTDTRGSQWGGAGGPRASPHWRRGEEEPGLEVGVRDPAVRSARLGAAAAGASSAAARPRGAGQHPPAPGRCWGAKGTGRVSKGGPPRRWGASTGSGAAPPPPPCPRLGRLGPPKARRGGATEPADGRAGRGGRPGPGGGQDSGSPGHATPALKPPRRSPQPPGPAMAAPV